MPRNFRAAGSFQAAGWYKMIRGKRLRIHCGDLGLPEEDWTEARSYQAAAAHWQKLIGERADNPARVERLATDLANHEAGVAENLLPIFVNKAMRDALDQLETENPEVMATYSHLIEEKFRERFDGIKNRIGQAPTPSDRTIGKQFEEWASLQFDAKKSLARKKMNIHMLQFFIDFMGKPAAVDEITESTWQRYWQHLSKMDYDEGYKSRIQAQARSFITWLFRKRLITLPANITDPNLAFVEVAKEIEVLPVDHVRTFYAKATGQTRLHILLGLNCGFNPVDISELKPTEVDLEEGTIRRRRSKLKKISKEQAKRVPIVTYKLWDETLRLMKEYKSDNAERALLTKNGLPWIQEELEEKIDGKYNRSDSVASNYKWLSAKSKVRITPKQLRTFASSQLGDKYPEMVHYFLGDAPQGTVDKHYYKRLQPKFFAALKWLENRIGLTK